MSLTLRIHSLELFERPVTLRLPFRFGAATVTHCPQAFVRLEASCNGRSVVGATAELMVPKWFDKSPTLTHGQNFEQLRESLRIAREAWLSAGDALTPHALSLHAGSAAMALGLARGLPRLVAQFGTAQMDKAVADAALRAAGLPWAEGLAAGVLGDPWSGRLDLRCPKDVALRHTVGLADRLHETDSGPNPEDGLPSSLEAAIRAYGLHYFKLKLSGQIEADVERLISIAAVLEAHAKDWRVTLDGNETFADAAALGHFWQRISTEPRLATLLQRTLLLEQPLSRRTALNEPIHALELPMPVILDESDDADNVFEAGLALGYRGISSKACKGLYRSLRNAARIAQNPGRLLLSGEDLTCQAGLAVQQDTLLATSLGVTHLERNGHHYVAGFGSAPPAEGQAFAAAYPALYRLQGERARLAVTDGRLALSQLSASAGFGSAAHPEWASLKGIG